MTEIRRLTTEDLLQFYRIHAIVYNQRRDFSKEENRKIDPLDHPADWACGVFESGKLLAGMYEIDFLMRFDGHSVKMTGIGGVGTLPEARKGGHIRRIFEKLLPEAYEKGVVFSNLTPFSHDFYRKFGYEIACNRNKIKINTGDLSEIKSKGEFIHILPGNDTSPLAEVHSAYIANINHGIHRDYWQENRAWKRFTKDDPCATGTYLYLWKDETGKARSYIKYQDEVEDGDHNMSVVELAFIDKKGLYGALSIVSGLSAQFENFKWLMPTFIDPFDFTGDAWSIEQEIRPRDMTRVVNVKAALELMRRPCNSEGKYIIEIKDENISANSGKYLVEFSPQGSKVSSTSKNADMSCDIRVLSQLIVGYRTPESAMLSRQEGLEVHDNLETLNRVFTQRPQHVTEYF
ncbi:MAG: GNAT family N-acetyltransferase [Treponema sp.]|jgi:predicted acetyltransferase|nr:GNAT family N-acetyltransferase [Treponema sp.]